MSQPATKSTAEAVAVESSERSSGAQSPSATSEAKHTSSDGPSKSLFLGSSPGGPSSQPDGDARPGPACGSSGSPSQPKSSKPKRKLDPNFSIVIPGRPKTKDSSKVKVEVKEDDATEPTKRVKSKGTKRSQESSIDDDGDSDEDRSIVSSEESFAPFKKKQRSAIEDDKFPGKSHVSVAHERESPWSRTS